jgi:hypothetical protein
MRALLVLASVLVAGCAPTVWLRTPAPPMTRVAFDPEHDRLEITQGVAVALDVFCPWTSCRDVRAVTDTPAVARGYRAPHGARPTTRVTTHEKPGLALVGVAPGQTALRLTDEGRTRVFTVTVLAPEGAAAAKPAAR